MYSISEASKLLEVSTHTLRYYEKEQLIEPDRSQHGERIYNDNHIKWLEFVMKLRQTQMPIMKIREYARLYKEGDQTSDARLKLLEDHRSSIQAQLSNLVTTDKMLEKKIAAYKAFISV